MAKGFKNKELMKKLFQKDKKDNAIRIDIDYFKEILSWEKDGLLKQKNHKPYILAYTWLISYLWKYGKYGEHCIGADDIKTLLGLNANDKKLNYITKRGGLLDTKAITKSSRNFPVGYEVVDGVFEIIHVDQLGEDGRMDFLGQYHNRYSCKMPIQQYDRGDKDGLLYSKHDAFEIDVSEWLRSMYATGVDGFYLYAYLKCRSKLLGGEFVHITLSELCNHTNYERRKVQRVIKELIEAGLLESSVELRVTESGFRQVNGYRPTRHRKKPK